MSRCPKPRHSARTRVLYAVCKLDAQPIAVLGDWHGDAGWAPTAIRSVARVGPRMALHVGDFGLEWPRAKRGRYEAKLPAVPDD
jgi:hypothetical protein